MIRLTQQKIILFLLVFCLINNFIHILVGARLKAKEYSLKLTTSSSTESGCDGSVDDRTDDESCIDDLVEEHLKKENRNANEKPLESENNSLNNSTIKQNNKPSIDNSIIAESSPNSSATKLESVKIYQSTDSDDHLLESIDDEMNRKEDKKIKSSSQTIDRESRALIDNVLKEFENPTSLYIPDK